MGLSDLVAIQAVPFGRPISMSALAGVQEKRNLGRASAARLARRFAGATGQRNGFAVLHVVSAVPVPAPASGLLRSASATGPRLARLP